VPAAGCAVTSVMSWSTRSSRVDPGDVAVHPSVGAVVVLMEG